MKEDFIHKTSCRVCKSSNLVKVLDLGGMPPANAFLKKEDLKKPEKKFPLVVYFCKTCGLLQLLDVVNPEALFRQYCYLTSTSKPLADHFVGLGKDLTKRFIKSKNDLVIDIGGNDAVLLESVKNICRVLNIEPAKNVAVVSRKKGVETICEFFNYNLAKRILKKYGPAKVLIASNVFAHIDNLDDVLNGVGVLLDKDGVFIVETHWVANLLGMAGAGGFDQIYHEHLSYFSLSVLEKLFNRYGFKIFDSRLIPIHGQSLQAYAGKNRKTSKSVSAILKKEKKLGLDTIGTYSSFAKKVAENKNGLKGLLLKLKKQNKKIVGYGAAAKGNTLLNYFQISNKILDFIVDDSLLKQGLYTPGTHIPIFPREKLKEAGPSHILLLAWNYAAAILEKEKGLKKEGVKFILPVPKIKII